MPAVHQRTFKVRYYECDAYGKLYNANYLRYMQETAFDASAAVGYDFSRYKELNRTWLIRTTDIEYLEPVEYGDTICIKTWVADFHRVRSIRAYEFRDKNTSELKAKAQTDWVFLNTTTGLPSSVSTEMIGAFIPEGNKQTHAKRRRLPRVSIPCENAYIDRRRVEWRDLDQVQHANNAVYLSYFDECGVRVAEAHKWPIERMQEENFAVVVHRHQVDYKHPAILGDELEVATWVSDVRRSTAIRHFVVSRVSDGETVANCRSFCVWVNVSSRETICIPALFLEDLRDNIVQ